MRPNFNFLSKFTKKLSGRLWKKKKNWPTMVLTYKRAHTHACKVHTQILTCPRGVEFIHRLHLLSIVVCCCFFTLLTLHVDEGGTIHP